MKFIKMDNRTKEFLIKLNKSMPKEIMKGAMNNDSKKVNEANQWMETKIKKAIKFGEITKPKNDTFTKMIKEKMK